MKRIVILFLSIYLVSCSASNEVIFWHENDEAVLIKQGNYYSVFSQEVTERYRCNLKGPFDIIKIISFEKKGKVYATVEYYDTDFTKRPTDLCEIDSSYLHSRFSSKELYAINIDDYPILIYSCE